MATLKDGKVILELNEAKDLLGLVNLWDIIKSIVTDIVVLQDKDFKGFERAVQQLALDEMYSEGEQQAKA